MHHEIRTIEWRKRDESVELTYAGHQSERLLATQEAAALLAPDVGLGAIEMTNESIRWSRDERDERLG